MTERRTPSGTISTYSPRLTSNTLEVWSHFDLTLVSSQKRFKSCIDDWLELLKKDFTIHRHEENKVSEKSDLFTDNHEMYFKRSIEELRY